VKLTPEPGSPIVMPNEPGDDGRPERTWWSTGLEHRCLLAPLVALLRSLLSVCEAQVYLLLREAQEGLGGRVGHL
jgi:hypothetical protein